MAAADAVETDPTQMTSETTMMIVKGDPNNPIVKRSVVYRKDFGENITRTLSETLYPSRIKILTHSHPTGSDDIWIKLSSGSLKRIAGSAKQDYVQNSHFTYEDMESRKNEEYEYTYLGTVTINVAGAPTECYRIEARKIGGAESRYSKNQIYLRTSDLMTVRTDMWDKNGNPHKTRRVLAIGGYRGDRSYTIATKIGISLVDDPTTKADEGENQYTIMEMNNIRVDGAANIKDSMFRSESL